MIDIKEERITEEPEEDSIAASPDHQSNKRKVKHFGIGLCPSILSVSLRHCLFPISFADALCLMKKMPLILLLRLPNIKATIEKSILVPVLVPLSISLFLPHCLFHYFSLKKDSIIGIKLQFLQCLKLFNTKVDTKYTVLCQRRKPVKFFKHKNLLFLAL